MNPILALSDSAALEITKTIATTVSAIVSPFIAAYSLYLMNKVHKSTNSGMIEQKKISWVSAETLANATGNAGHVALAQEAKEVYQASLPVKEREQKPVLHEQ